MSEYWEESNTIVSAKLQSKVKQLEADTISTTRLKARIKRLEADLELFDKLRTAIDEGRASIIVEGVVNSLDGGEIYTDLNDALDALDTLEQ